MTPDPEPRQSVADGKPMDEAEASARLDDESRFHTAKPSVADGDDEKRVTEADMEAGRQAAWDSLTDEQKAIANAPLTSPSVADGGGDERVEAEEGGRLAVTRSAKDDAWIDVRFWRDGTTWGKRYVPADQRAQRLIDLAASYKAGMWTAEKRAEEAEERAEQYCARLKETEAERDANSASDAEARLSSAEAEVARRDEALQALGRVVGELASVEMVLRGAATSVADSDPDHAHNWTEYADILRHVQTTTRAALEPPPPTQEDE